MLFVGQLSAEAARLQIIGKERDVSCVLKDGSHAQARLLVTEAQEDSERLFLGVFHTSSS